MALDQQNLDNPLDLMWLFTNDELFGLWQAQNARHYFYYGPSPKNDNIPIEDAYLILYDIIVKAERAIANRRIAADLRFGHDIYLLPLAAALEFEGCCDRVDSYAQVQDYWADFAISSKAGNIQMILFRKESDDDILVKFMLNEREMRLPIATAIAPFYRWEDVRSYYLSLMHL